MKINDDDMARMRSDQPLQNLKDPVERQLHEHAHYTAQYGMRSGDGAGVVQIFPGEASPRKQTPIRDALDTALLEHLKANGWEYKAEYIYETDLGLNTYYIEIPGLRRSPTPYAVLRAFLARVDAAFPSDSSGH
jgi:uncharacterized protein (DUF4415 family)